MRKSYAQTLSYILITRRWKRSRYVPIFRTDRDPLAIEKIPISMRLIYTIRKPRKYGTRDTDYQSRYFSLLVRPSGRTARVDDQSNWDSNADLVIR